MIVDDEPLAQKNIEGYVYKISSRKLIEKFNNAEEARSFIHFNPAHILFLDIEMPEESGVQLLRSIISKPVTILISAHLQYCWKVLNSEYLITS